MKYKRKQLQILCILTVLLGCCNWGSGCSTQSNQQNSLSVTDSDQNSLTQSSEKPNISDVASPAGSEVSQVPKGLDVGQKLRVGKLNVIVTDVYRSQYLRVDSQLRYPKEGKIFIIVQLTLENTYAEFLNFRASDMLKPSVDGTDIELKGLANHYPDYLDNAHNLVNRGTVTVNGGDIKKGYVMFEAPIDFKTGELTFFDETQQLAGSFAFENLPMEVSSEASQPSQIPSEQPSAPAPSEASQPLQKQTADADGLTFTEVDFIEDDGSKLGIDQYADVNKFWQVKLKITNHSDSQRAFTFNDLSVVCGSKKHETLFSTSSLETIAPGASVEGEVIFAVEKSDNAGVLHYSSRTEGIKDYVIFPLIP